MSGISESAGETDIKYEYPNEYCAQASTTGNMSGVFDMCGGAWEYVAAYINNSNESIYAKKLVDSDSRYKEIYQVGLSDEEELNYSMNSRKCGDAIYEVSSNGKNSPIGWNGDYSYFSCLSDPFLIRGGNYYDNIRAGVFAFGRGYGSAYIKMSFRVVISVMS